MHVIRDCIKDQCEDDARVVVPVDLQVPCMFKTAELQSFYTTYVKKRQNAYKTVKFPETTRTIDHALPRDVSVTRGHGCVSY